MEKEAIPPDSGTYSGAFDFPLTDCSETFSICEMADYSYSWRLFFYNNGDPKKYVTHEEFLGGVYECGNPDNFLPYIPLHYSWTYYFATNESVYHGVVAQITVPGHGVILHDAGHIRFDYTTHEVLFEAGKHNYWNGEFDAVCEFLMNGQ